MKKYLIGFAVLIVVSVAFYFAKQKNTLTLSANKASAIIGIKGDSLSYCNGPDYVYISYVHDSIASNVNVFTDDSKIIELRYFKDLPNGDRVYKNIEVDIPNSLFSNASIYKAEYHTVKMERYPAGDSYYKDKSGNLSEKEVIAMLDRIK